MKICLINPPDLNSLDPKLDSPVGLMYLSAYLKKNGFECEIIDLAFYEKSKWKNIIKNHPADLYGLGVYTASVEISNTINKIIKTEYPESKIVWGGPHPTFDLEGVFKNYPEVDFIISGEGEETLLEFCRNFNRPKIYDKISGLSVRNSNVMKQPRPLIKNLDDMPFPDRDSVPIYEYTRTVDGIKSVSIMTSRGCAYNCRFCCSKKFWLYPRFQSAEFVFKEIELIKRMGFKAFHCWDDTFTLNHKRLFEILNKIKKLKMIFRCNGDLRRDTKEILQKLYDAGCREYAVGIESGDQRILDAINKQTTVERNKQVLQWAKELGLSVKAYIMVGNPGETWESVEKTLKFIKETGPEYYSVFNFIPLPGCEFYSNPSKYKIKIKKRNWSEYFMLGKQNEGGLTHDTEFMTAEEIAEARLYLLKNLPKQKGKLQKYYEKLK